MRLSFTGEVYNLRDEPQLRDFRPDSIRRVEIPVEGCIGTDGDKIIILDADDSLDIIIERRLDADGDLTERECIHSWLKEPEL